MLDLGGRPMRQAEDRTICLTCTKTELIGTGQDFIVRNQQVESLSANVRSLLRIHVCKLFGLNGLLIKASCQELRIAGALLWNFRDI